MFISSGGVISRVGGGGGRCGFERGKGERGFGPEKGGGKRERERDDLEGKEKGEGVVGE